MLVSTPGPHRLPMMLGKNLLYIPTIIEIVSGSTSFFGEAIAVSFSLAGIDVFIKCDCCINEDSALFGGDYRNMQEVSLKKVITRCGEGQEITAFTTGFDEGDYNDELAIHQPGLIPLPSIWHL